MTPGSSFAEICLLEQACRSGYMSSMAYTRALERRRLQTMLNATDTLQLQRPL
jgi:hypothetical protein